MTFIIDRDMAAVKILKNRRVFLSRISIRFRIHVWLGCSIPRGCFYDKLCGNAGTVSCTLAPVDSIIN